MKTLLLSALFLAQLALTNLSLAGNPVSYQVTGPVLELTDSIITVQKGDERWQIARSAETKVKGDLKVGSKVTIEYTMTASSVEVKPTK